MALPLHICSPGPVASDPSLIRNLEHLFPRPVPSGTRAPGLRRKAGHGATPTRIGDPGSEPLARPSEGPLVSPAWNCLDNRVGVSSSQGDLLLPHQENSFSCLGCMDTLGCVDTLGCTDVGETQPGRSLPSLPVRLDGAAAVSGQRSACSSARGED